MLGDLEGEASSRPAWVRSSYDFSTVVPDYIRTTYRGDSCVSNEIESLSDCSVEGDAAHFSIDDTGMGIFLMVKRSGASSC